MTARAKASTRKELLRKRSELASIVFSFPQGSPERLDTEQRLQAIKAELQALKG